MFDFEKYDDLVLIKDYNGFIDRLGNFYRVCPKKCDMTCDSHNLWAEQYMKQKLKMEKINFNKTESLLFALTRLSSPTEILVNCYGFVYYSHDPLYFKPIIKVPNPKIANHKITEEQLDILFSIMMINNENTNIPIFYPDNEEFEYCGNDDQKTYKKI